MLLLLRHLRARLAVLLSRPHWERLLHRASAHRRAWLLMRFILIPHQLEMRPVLPLLHLNLLVLLHPKDSACRQASPAMPFMRTAPLLPLLQCPPALVLLHRKDSLLPPPSLRTQCTRIRLPHPPQSRPRPATAPWHQMATLSRAFQTPVRCIRIPLLVFPCPLRALSALQPLKGSVRPAAQLLMLSIRIQAALSQLPLLALQLPKDSAYLPVQLQMPSTRTAAALLQRLPLVLQLPKASAHHPPSPPTRPTRMPHQQVLKTPRRYRRQLVRMLALLLQLASACPQQAPQQYTRTAHLRLLRRIAHRQQPLRQSMEPRRLLVYCRAQHRMQFM